MTMAAAITLLDPARDACEQQAHDNIWTDWLLAPSCTPSVATKVGEAIWGSQFQPFVDDAKNGVADTTKTMATFWVSVPDPNVGDMTTGAPSEVVAFLQSSLLPFVGVIMIVSMIMGFIRLMYSERGLLEAREILSMLVRYIIVSGGLVIAVASMLAIARAGTTWILEQSTLGTHFAENLFALFNNSAGVTSAIVVFLLLLVGAGVGGLQVVVMIFRGGIIIVKVGVLLLTVARSNSPSGKQAFGEECGKIAAWVIYPFSAAIVYAAGFRFMGTDPNVAGNGLLEILYGIAIMLMAIFALPATMRLVVPAVAPAAGGRGIGAALAGAATTFVVLKSR